MSYFREVVLLVLPKNGWYSVKILDTNFDRVPVGHLKAD